VSVDPAHYRDAQAHAAMLERDPIALASARFLALGGSSAELDAMVQAARQEIDAAQQAALEAPWPAAEEAFEDVIDSGAGRWY
jgi:TPP-dependent pyruvate/acetoin dehydrogenase alpha subunit